MNARLPTTIRAACSACDRFPAAANASTGTLKWRSGPMEFAEQGLTIVDSMSGVVPAGAVQGVATITAPLASDRTVKVRRSFNSLPRPDAYPVLFVVADAQLEITNETVLFRVLRRALQRLHLRVFAGQHEPAGELRRGMEPSDCERPARPV
jgi:hypothetical protein